MNKNVTALIFIVLAIGIYFTFTRNQLAQVKAIQSVNAEYQKALSDSKDLLKIRDRVLNDYNQISEVDRARLNKLVPDNVDNVRLIIDVKDDIAAKHNLFLKNIKSASPDSTPSQVSNTGVVAAPQATIGGPEPLPTGQRYGVATLSFTVTASYDAFIAFLRDLESSLRIMDVSKLSIKAGEKGSYDFSVELKTYWLKQ